MDLRLEDAQADDIHPDSNRQIPTSDPIIYVKGCSAELFGWHQHTDAFLVCKPAAAARYRVPSRTNSRNVVQSLLRACPNRPNIPHGECQSARGNSGSSKHRRVVLLREGFRDRVARAASAGQAPEPLGAARACTSGPSAQRNPVTGTSAARLKPLSLCASERSKLRRARMCTVRGIYKRMRM